MGAALPKRIPQYDYAEIEARIASLMTTVDWAHHQAQRQHRPKTEETWAKHMETIRELKRLFDATGDVAYKRELYMKMYGAGPTKRIKDLSAARKKFSPQNTRKDDE